MSVILILDTNCEAVQVLTSIIIAISRAQYEVVFRVNEEFKSSFTKLMETKPTRYLQRFANLPNVSEKLFTCEDFEPLREDDHAMRLFIGSVVVSEKLSVLISFVKNFPSDRKAKFALTIFKSFMLVQREGLDDFLKALKYHMGDEIKNSIEDALNGNNFKELEGKERLCTHAYKLTSPEFSFRTKQHFCVNLRMGNLPQFSA